MNILAGLLCSLLISGPTVAQNGYLENDPIWSCGTECNWGIAHCFERDDFNLYLCGDTVIADTMYRKLCQHGVHETYWYYSPPPSPDCEVGWYFYEWTAGFLRESGKRLFFRASWQPDTLLYDFDLEVGDTLPSAYLLDGAIQTLVVSEMDSILIGSNWRKRFNLDDGQGSFLLEGIGSSNGLMSPIGWNWACANGLTCFGLGGTAYFPEVGVDCDLHLGVSPFKPPLEKLNARPNPTSDLISVAVPWRTERLGLVDAFGRIVLTVSGPFPPTVSLNVSDLSRGTYFLKAEGRPGILGKAVVLVQ